MNYLDFLSLADELDVLLSSLPKLTDLDDMELDFDNVTTADPAATTDDEWVTFEFRVPQGAEHIIENEIERMMSIHEFQPDVPEIVRRGLMLIKMAINSALTPKKCLV